LGIDLAGGACGGAVFDGAGRAICVSWTAGDSADRLIPVSALRRWLGPLLNETAEASLPQMPTDAIYETALRATVLLRANSP
jgi:hypothetical protein